MQAVLHEAEAAHAAALHAARLEAARDGSALRRDLDAAAAAARGACSATVASERSTFESRLRAELEEAAQRRDAHVAALTANHASALGEIKKFYDATSAEQLDAIKRFKEELAASRAREAALEAQNAELGESGKRLGDALGKASKEAEELRPGAASAEKDKVSTAAALSRLAKAEKALKNAEWELEVKTQLADALKKERDELLTALDAAEAGSRKPGGRLLSTAGSTRGAAPPPTPPSAHMAGLNFGR